MTEEKYSLGVLDTPQKKDNFIKYMIQDYSKKDSHKEQSDLPDRCFSVVIDNDGSEIIFTNKHDNDDDLINDLIETYPQTYSTNIMNVLQQAQEKSKNTKKPSFIHISLFGHSFCLVVFNNKICIIDSSRTQHEMIFKKLLQKINIDKQLNLDIKTINTNQQSDIESCPYFTGFNITRLDKWLQEDPKNFNKLFNKKELLFSLISSMQSINKIQNKLNIDIKPLKKKDGVKIKFKTETKPKKYFDTKTPKQQIEKLIKYIRYNKTKNKLQNLRIFYKSRDMLIKFLEANKDFSEQETIIQSPIR